MDQYGLPKQFLQKEINQREKVLDCMQERSIKNYRDVARVLTEYNAKPDEFYEKEVEAFVIAKNA